MPSKLSMSVSESMRKWSQSLEKDFFDEDIGEIQIGDSTVTSLSVTVRGVSQGRGIVAIFSEYLASATGRLEGKHILDIFVTDNTLTFDGLLRPRTFVDKLLGFIGLRKGSKPNGHSLFQTFFLDAPKGQSTDDFQSNAYCDALRDFGTSIRLHKVEWSEGSGINFYIKLGAGVTAGNFNKLCSRIDAILTARTA